MVVVTKNCRTDMAVWSGALSWSINKSCGSTIVLDVFSRLASSVAPKPLGSNAGYQFSLEEQIADEQHPPQPTRSPTRSLHST